MDFADAPEHAAFRREFRVGLDANHLDMKRAEASGARSATRPGAASGSWR